MTGRAFDPGEPVAYAWAGEFLDAWVAARSNGDISSFVDRFSEDATLQPSSFEPPIEGTNAIRAYFLQRVDGEADVDLTIERHWVSGATILAAWHGSFLRRPGGGRVREAGVLAAEMASGRCRRFRVWKERAPNAG
jgi:ketosteroid isomerase-like protein